jgi:hypothetical protein
MPFTAANIVVRTSVPCVVRLEYQRTYWSTRLQHLRHAMNWRRSKPTILSSFSFDISNLGRPTSTAQIAATREVFRPRLHIQNAGRCCQRVVTCRGGRTALSIIPTDSRLGASPRFPRDEEIRLHALPWGFHIHRHTKNPWPWSRGLSEIIPTGVCLT